MSKKTKSVASKAKMSMSEAISFVDEQIKNNIMLIEKGIRPPTNNFIGEPGIGKTSIFKSLDTKLVEINTPEGKKQVPLEIIVIRPSSFSDPADVTGLPVQIAIYNLKYHNDPKRREKLFDLICLNESYDHTNHNVINVVNNIIDDLQEDVIIAQGLNFEYSYLYNYKNIIKTKYALPNWLSESINNDKNEVVTIYVFDDYSRCEPEVLNTLMPVINDYETVSYKLPKYSMIFTTSNPDDGENHVVPQDSAQQSRKNDFIIDYTFDSWKLWAIKSGAMNTSLYLFLKDNKELLFKKAKSDTDITLNPRIWEKFNNVMMSDLNKLEKIEDLRSNAYNIIKNKLVIRMSQLTNNVIGAAFDKFLSTDNIYIPPMEDFMRKWSDDDVFKWLSLNVGLSKNNKNLSVSLLLSMKIGVYLLECYRKPEKELDEVPFKRFVRLNWDINKKSQFVDPKTKVKTSYRGLKLLASSHLALLSAKVYDFCYTNIYDTQNNLISSNSLKASTLRDYVLKEDDVVTSLNGVSFSDILNGHDDLLDDF